MLNSRCFSETANVPVGRWQCELPLGHTGEHEANPHGVHLHWEYRTAEFQPIVQVQRAEIERLRRALEQIRDDDSGGNEPHRIAVRALSL